MQAIMESVFDIIYLITVLTMGIIMFTKEKESKQYRFFGIMAILLGLGDSFHLIPRVYAYFTTGLDHFTYALGIGKMITSITMTIFYVLLYYIWRQRYNKHDKKKITVFVYSLAIIRILMCLVPQNGWTSSEPPLTWAIYRNIPFVLLGASIVVLFYQSAKEAKDNSFRYMWLAILLSFICYIPVVLFAHSIPLIGMLMIPKTCAYLWAVFIGFHSWRIGD